MLLTPHPAPVCPKSGSALSTTRLSQLLAASVLVVGTGALVTDPVAPATSETQHHAVQLASTSDWSEMLDTAQANLATVEHEFMAQPFAVLTQIGHNLQDYGQLIIGMDDVMLNPSGSKTITSGFEGFMQGVQQSLTGFDGHAGIPGLLDLPQDMITNLQNGDALQAFSDLDNWLLDSMEVMLKPLVPIVTIPERMLQNYTSVMTDIAGPESLWDFGKAVDKAFMEPMLGLGFEYSGIVGQVQSELADGDIQGVIATLNNAPAQLADALLNGYEVPDTGKTFIGLLSAGGTLESLLVTWPERIANDLMVGTADLPVNATDTVTSGAEALAGGTGLDFTDLLAGP